jgi:hypothetical protein
MMTLMSSSSLMIISFLVSYVHSTLRGRSYLHQETHWGESRWAESKPTSQPIGKTTQSNGNSYIGRNRYPSSRIHLRLLSLKTSLLSKQVLQGDLALIFGIASLQSKKKVWSSLRTMSSMKMSFLPHIKAPISRLRGAILWGVDSQSMWTIGLKNLLRRERRGDRDFNSDKLMISSSTLKN